ncbi:hypothetical protein GCM10023084_05530 [Streptomyces lacrimifluminis]|uniref:Uncharacterized protein n=1 Tax=Streptomyces lacrimifluminis TaxID=1500077 RepID=A0A917KNT0_9ACTN|nr:hypothetical protein [Streptomyces lacrimifluminis]GGJ22923.1 hypothetical protein GCM10012282_19270 [Streptomyces lacrimifluminis]
MATTQIPYSSLVPNGNLAQPAGTTTVVAPTNNMQISNAFPELTVLRVVNTGVQQVITVKAGDNPPALAAGQGDLAVTVAATTGVQFIGPFESGRFVQSDGSMMIEAATVDATITAFKIPRNT